MNIPGDLQYTETHEWIRQEDDEIVVGITDFAQMQLSDMTYVELPTIGDQVEAGDEVAVLESVKAASDIYAPVDGTITEVNEVLAESPELLNADPYGEGWLFKLRPANLTDLDALMEAEDYEASLPDE